MTAQTVTHCPTVPPAAPDAGEPRIAAAFRATFWITVALLSLCCTLLLAHGDAAAPGTQPVAEGYGWPI